MTKREKNIRAIAKVINRAHGISMSQCIALARLDTQVREAQSEVTELVFTDGTKMKYPCPVCGNGTVVSQIEVNYVTKVRGCEFTVPKAKVERCQKCGEGFFSAKELKRWRDLFYKSLSDNMKIRLLGANGYEFLEGNSRVDAALVKRGLVVDTGSGLMALTKTGQKVRVGLLQ